MEIIRPTCDGCQQQITDLQKDQVKVVHDRDGYIKPIYSFICPRVDLHGEQPYRATPEVDLSEISWALREGVERVDFSSTLSEFEVYEHARIEQNNPLLTDSDISDWVIDLNLMKTAVTAHREFNRYVTEYSKIESA